VYTLEPTTGVPMSLTRPEVEKVALLARLILSEEELETMTAQLGKILDYVDQLAQVDTDGVVPMAHAVELTNVMADDVPRESLPREKLLAGAPKHDDQYYRVPAVLGE
jgi:aspartyl-tRNA(Asn)/glutamyl-tRNA(Gln) amidotransferase subunit C